MHEAHREVQVQMVWNKLVYFLEQGDWHSYRCMLNEQRVRYLKSLDVDPIDGLIPKPPTKLGPKVLLRVELAFAELKALKILCGRMHRRCTYTYAIACIDSVMWSWMDVQ